MVAIVAGNSLGLMLGSQGALGARGSFGSAALGGNGATAYVNATTGNLVLQNQDDLLAGHGLDTVSLRTYNSQGRFDDDNGDNWTLGLYARQLRLIGPLNAAGSTIERTGRDGSVAVFSYDAASGAYLSTAGAGAHDLIRHDAATGELVWTEGSTQVRERHDAQGRLVSTLDPAGNSLQYAYGANGLVSMITQGGDGAQRTYYDYDGTLLTQIRTVGADGVSQTRVRYGYDVSRRLSTVTVDLTPEDGSVADGKVFQTTYRYDGDSLRVSGVAQSDGTSLAIEYVLVGADYRVRTLTDGAGAVTRFDYDVANRRTTVTDPRQQATIYTYDGQGQLLQVDAPAVNGAVSSSRFEYNASGDVTRIVDGEGRWVATSYDAWGNPIRQSDSAGNVVLRAYDAARQLVAESVAGDGSTQSASTRYVHAQGNPTLVRFVISPEGRVTEYRYNGFGERAATIEYAADVFAVSGLAYDAVPSEAAVAAWAAARDLTRTQRRDFEYDGLGQLSRSFAYATVDAQGNGVADATRSMTQYVYDAGGRLLKTIDARGGATVYTYDGLGRVLTVKDAAQRLTTTLHDDANRRLVVTQFNGLITTSSFDRAGRLVSVVEGSAQVERLGETSYFYDARGQQLMSRDATGARHWFVYDAAGRRVGEVDALGTLTEYRFDANGQVTSTIRYATLVNTAMLVDGAGAPLTVSIESLRPASSAKDQRAWRVYDEVNRLVKEVSALGEVTEYVYDQASRVVLTRKYAGLIDVSGLGSKPAAGAIWPTPSAADAWTRTFYDADGQMTATLDAVGTMVENQFDAAGRLVTSIRRSNRVDGAAMLTGTLAQLRPAASADDATTRYFHDAQGRLVVTLDALNYLTEKVYDAGGNVTRELRYAARSPAATAASAVASLRAGDVLQSSAWSYDAINRMLTKSSDPDGLKLTTRYQYDDAGRRLDVTDPAGTVTRTVYDVQGQVKSVTVDQGGLGITTSTTYDAEGRVLISTDAAGTVTQFGYDALGRKTSQRVDPTGLNLTTLYAYDVQGNLARVIDPNGKQTRYAYDGQGRLRYTLDAEGGLAENVYDGLGRVVTTVRYVKRQLDWSTVSDGIGVVENRFGAVQRDANLDERTFLKYDAAGRKVAEIDAMGSVTEFVYDASGYVVRTVQYAQSAKNLLNNGSFTEGTSGGYGMWSLDQSSVTWGNQLNADWSVPGQGTLWLRQGDNHGDRAVLTNHVTPAVPGQRYFVSALAGAHRAGATLSVHFVDANGNFVSQADLAGGKLSIGPDEASGGTSLDGYALLSGYFTAPQGAAYIRIDINKAPTAVGYTDSYLFVANMALRLADPAATDGKGWRPASSASDRVTQFKYDAAGQKIAEIDAAGSVTEFAYDAAGHVVKTIQYAQSARNLLNNGSFTEGTSGGYGMWSPDQSSVTWGNRLNADWSVPGQGTLWLRQGDNHLDRAVLTNHATPAVPGQRYYVSVLAGAHRAGATLSVHFVDANGNFVAQADLTGGKLSIGSNEASGGQSLEGYALLSGYFTAPPGAAYIRIDVNKAPTEAAYTESYLFVANMALRLANPAATDPSGWRPQATAEDRVTRFKYDAAGRKIGEIDAAGAVKEYVLDAAGRVSKVVEYAQPATKNLLSNSDFKNGAAGGYGMWSLDQATVTWGNRLNEDWSVPGQGTLWLRQGDNHSTSAVITNHSTPAIPGQRYYVSALVGAHRSIANLQVYFVDEAGNYVSHAALEGGDTSAGVNEASGGRSLEGYKKLSGSFTVPQRAAYIRIDVIKGATEPGFSDSYLFVANMSLQLANVDAVDAKNWRPTTTVNDRVTQFKYDAAGRKIAEIDATGSVTEFVHDAAGHVVKTIQYAQSAKNLLSNGSFTEGISGGYGMWTLDPGSVTWGNRLNADWSVPGQGTLWLRQEANSSDGAVLTNHVTPAVPGQRYFVSALAGVHRATASLGVYFVDANGNFVSRAELTGGKQSIGLDEASGGPTLEGYAQLSGYFTAPPGAAYIRIDVTKSVTAPGFSDSYLFVASMALRAANPAAGDASGWRPQASVDDRVTRTVYDALGHPTYTLAPLGAVTRQRFNAAGDVIETIQYGRRYGGAADLASMDAFFANASNQTSLDRSTRYIRDESGRLRFTVDALGGVVETVYGAFGEVARTIAYASPVAPSAVTDATSPASLRAMLPASPVDARETLYGYDADGRLRYTAISQRSDKDAKYFSVSERLYDALGRVVGTTDFATTLALQDLPLTASADQIAARVVRSGQDRVRTLGYDAAGRLRSSTDGEGNIESYEYDALGNKTRHINQAGSAFDFAYDVAGRLVQETSPLTTLSRLDGTQLASVQDRVVTRLSYNAFGELSARTEAFGRPEQRTTRYEYDARGRQTLVRYEAVGVYDPASDSLATNGANGVVARTETLAETYSQTVYDVFGQATINRDVAGVLSYKTYDKLGRLLNEVDGNHEVTTHYYSATVGEYSGFTRQGARAQFTDGLSVSAAAVDAAVAAIAGTGSPRSASTYFDKLGRVSTSYDKIVSASDLSGAAFSYDAALNAWGNWAGLTEYAYNAFGEVTQRAELLDRSSYRYARTRYVYDQQGHLVREVNAEGYVTQREYDAFGEQTKETQYARAISPDGDVMAAPVASSSTGGGDPSLGYDRVTVSAYDRRGVKTSETLQATQIGARWGDRTLVRRVVDVVTTFTLDKLGRQTGSSKAVIENGIASGQAETTRTFYDELGRTRATVDEAGRVVVYDRDAHGNALRITRLGTKSTDGGIPGTGSLDQTTLQRYDKLSRLVWTQAATSAETFYSRDARGLVVKQWQPFTEWSLQSGAATSAAALTVGRNAIQLFSYDGVGRQNRTSTLTQRAAGDALTFTTEDVVYNAFGEITSRLRDGATIEQNAYDAGGRLWRSTAKGVSTVFWYDLHGNVTSSFTSDTANLASLSAAKDVDDTARRTTTTYDRLGRTVAQSGPAVSHDEGRAATRLATSQTLDAWGNVLSLSRNGVLRQTNRYDAGNHAIVSYTHNVDSVDERGVTSSGPILSQAFYDASGRQVGAIDGAGIYSSWTYNSSWLLDTEYRGDRTQVSYQYDGLGRVTLRGDGVGRFYGFSYDNADRETGRTVFLSGGPTYQLGRSRYDELGRKIGDTTGEDAAKYGQTTIYWYDARGNLTATAKPMGQRTSYAYDAAGNRVRETDANGLSATWAYDSVGQLTSHADIGGATYSYGYDFAGELKTQTSTRGQSLSYEYAASGLVRKVTDGYRGSSTTYDYDAEGNRTRETFKEGGVTYRDVTSTYDRQGRLSSAVERGYALFGTTYTFNVSYDAAGNRRRVWGTTSNHANESHYGVSDDADRSFDQWFTYDGMNRVVINEGKLSNGSISEIDATNVFAYDGAGRRRESTTKYGGPYPSGYALAYEYDFADRLTKESSRTLSGASYVGTTWTPQSQTEYRKEGQQIATGWEMPYGGGAAVRLTTSTTTYNENGQAVSSKSYIQGLATSRTTATGQYLLADQSMSYDQVGNLKQVLNTSYGIKSGSGDYYQVRPTYKASSTTTNYSYYLQEGYKERGQGLTGTAWNENGNPTVIAPSQTYQSYDANGNVMQLQRGASDFRWYVTDTAGHIVTSYSGAGQALGRANQDDTMRVWDPTAAGGAGQTSGSADKLASKPGAPQRAYSNYAYQETQLYVNDRRIGSVSETQEEVEEYDWNDHYSYHRESVAVSMDVSGLGYETRPQSGSMVTYTVQAGETLRSLATRFYGDESLWYRIAEANAFADGKAVLTPGATINIPNVTRALNSASSGAVYKPETLIGDVSAPVVMPPPPPAGRAGCGAMGMILVVIVTIVVSYVTYGALTSETSGIMTKLAAGAAAGAAGSVAGQATANVVGLQNGFSWKQVGMGAIGGMVTAGMQDAGWLKGFGDAASAVGAATGNAITQGIGVVTGLQDGFNWKSVAISAISAPIADKVSEQLGGTFKQWGMSTDGIKIGQSIARGLVSQTVRIAVMGKGRIDFAQVAGDAFGNAIGDSIANRTAQGVGPWSSVDYRNGSDIEDDTYVARKRELYGLGGMGARLGSSDGGAVARWSRIVDQGIRDGARAWSNWDAAWGDYTRNQDLEAAAREEMARGAQNIRAERYGSQLKQAGENANETRRLLNRSKSSSMEAPSDPFMDPFGTSPERLSKPSSRNFLKDLMVRSERVYTEGEKIELRRVATAEVMKLAETSIRWAISRDNTSPLAKMLLTEFLGSGGIRSRTFGPSSSGTQELFGGSAGKYFESETMKAIEYMAKKYGGKIPDGATLTRYKSSDFGAIEGLKGAVDGFRVGDVVGTFSTGVHVVAKNGVLYFSAGNMMTLESFAAQNSLGHSWVQSPTSGRFSPTRQVFQWVRPVPDTFKD